jgi:hypothetical protein
MSSRPCSTSYGQKKSGFEALHDPLLRFGVDCLRIPCGHPQVPSAFFRLPTSTELGAKSDAGLARRSRFAVADAVRDVAKEDVALRLVAGLFVVIRNRQADVRMNGPGS